MYVCKYVCMYVCMYVCKYVCKHLILNWAWSTACCNKAGGYVGGNIAAGRVTQEGQVVAEE